MRKFVLFSLIHPAQSFSSNDLATISSLPSDNELARYIEERILEASLQKLGDYGSLCQLELYCKFYGRRPTGKLPVKPPIIEQKADVWIQKGLNLAMAIDLPLNLSPIATALLSAGLYGKLDGVGTLELDKESFLKLLNKIESMRGRLTSIHLRNVREPYSVGVLQISEAKGIGLEDFPGLREAINSSKIKRLGFRFQLGGDEFSFWIANFGNGTLYAPLFPEPHHIGKLLLFFAKALRD